MRILIVNADYPAFLNWLYANDDGLAERTYDEQMHARNESLFGVADFYSRSLRSLGHEAWDVHANNETMQNAWAREHGVNTMANDLLKKAKRLAKATPLRYLRPIVRPLVPLRSLYDVLAAQIRHHRPDILFNQAVDEIPGDFLWEMKPNTRMIVGQIASPWISQKKFRSYDLMLSSLPNFVKYFRSQGIHSELHRLAFEPTILARLEGTQKTTEASFVGSLSAEHAGRLHLFETICANVDLAWWGPGARSLPKQSNIARHYRGEAWGLQMYQVLQSSKVTVNTHIDIAENYANNMRLFEATGAGTMLITDRKDNLHEMFEPGKEVGVYSSAEECVEVIRYYLEHASEREAIARAGQQRTLRDHNYTIRMQEFVEILTRSVATRAPSSSKQ